MYEKTPRVIRFVALALIALIWSANVALADDIIVDGDGDTPIVNSDLSFGNSVCAGVATAPKTIIVGVRRNGSGTNVYKNGSTVTVSASVPSGSGVTATNPGAIDLPATWSTTANNTISSDTATGTVAVNRSTLGAFSITLTYTGAGINGSDAAITRSDTMTVSGTVISCDSTPPDTSIGAGAPSSPTNSTSASFVYSSTEAGSTFECKLDAGSFASCPAAGKSYTGLAEGAHTFEVRATDGAGNTDPSPASHSWTIDLTDPDTTIVTGPPALTASDDASFTYSSTETGSTFECKLDAGSFASCPAAGKSYSVLAEGSHTFAVRATDAAGNLDDTPATHSWDIDLTPPAVSAPDLTDASDSGASQVDDVTNDATPTLTGTAEDGALVELLRDGTVVDSTTASGGVWSFTSGSLADGTYEFAARATDAAGNAATSSALSVLVDTVDPTITPATRLPAANGSGWNNSPVTVTWDCADAGSGPVASSDSDTVSGEGAGQTANGSCADVAGNTASDSVGDINIDTTNPSITPASRLPAANGAGWNNTPVTVTWDCDDALSGAVDAQVSDTQDGEGAGQTAEGTCVDLAGNAASDSLGGINIDLTAPSASASAAKADSSEYVAGTWSNQDVTVSFDCSDLLSGVASLDPASTTLNADGADQSASTVCTDAAGNTAGASFGDIDIDKTAPEISASATKADASEYTSGWTNQDVTVSFDCSDALSGVAFVTPSSTLGEGEDQSVAGTCTDYAGNSAGTSFTNIDIDQTAPEITASATKTDTSEYTSGWTNQDVTVSFDCSDALSGVASVTPSSTLGEGADQSVAGTCTDNAGNSAGTSFSDIDIDQTDPVITFQSRTPVPNGYGWNNGPVTVQWGCSDALSGPVAATASDTRSGEGLGQIASGVCTDLAGNSAGDSVGGINIDLTDPYAIQWNGGPAAGGSYYFGSVPAAPTCSASDDLAGLDTCAVTGYLATVGSHTMTATATDRAGNDATATRSYNVLAWTLKGFYQPVDMSGVWNTVKGGSTVPLKWEMFAGATELTDTALVSLAVKQVACEAGTGEDAVELTATGGTSLRYDTTAGQFIFNWQTPKKPGTCYRVTMTAADGSPLSALFKLK